MSLYYTREHRGVYSGGAQGIAEAIFEAFPEADVYRRLDGPEFGVRRAF